MQSVTQWGCYEVESGVHVCPMMDVIDHDLDEDCVCVPSPERVDTATGGDGWVFVHHSLDGRESRE